MTYSSGAHPLRLSTGGFFTVASLIRSLTPVHAGKGCSLQQVAGRRFNTLQALVATKGLSCLAPLTRWKPPDLLLSHATLQAATLTGPDTYDALKTVQTVHLDSGSVFWFEELLSLPLSSECFRLSHPF